MWSAAVILALLSSVALSASDTGDVAALAVLYSSLGNPPQLSGWSGSSGGDPCGSGWKGVSCNGSRISALQLSGMDLNGSLGYRLSDLTALQSLDVSNNSIGDTIPYQLPPNLAYLNLGGNRFSGNLPYSLSAMHSLSYLNVSHNLLTQQIGDLFANLSSLDLLDLSFNNFSSELPTSLGSLSNLSALYVQNNQLTGSVNILANLSLTTLNIANNHFNGSIPQEFSSIPNLIVVGNSFLNGPAPPPFSSPPLNIPRSQTNGMISTPQQTGPSEQHEHKENGLSAAATSGIVLGSTLAFICVILAIFVRTVKRKNENADSKSDDYTGSLTIDSNRDIPDQRYENSLLAKLKPLSSEKIATEKVDDRHTYGKKQTGPINATAYTVATLQIATNSFGQDCLLGGGSLGRVYRAEFPNGKILAVKKVDSAAHSLQEEENFLEAVSNISRLRHPNIVPLAGYCVEYGQRLLVYDFVGNGTLNDLMHLSEDGSKQLNWNRRVRIALGTARALEYLHEVCLPSVVHKNLKSANILLDEEFNPHLSDCGLSMLTTYAERQVSAEIVGSFGYSAPEFAMSGIYTSKSDVYSFGVVMLELLTGRKPLDSSRARTEQSLVRWAAPQLHDIDALAKMVDPALNGMYPAKSVSRFADIIALCVQPEPEFRPPMSEVVQQLVRLMQRASILRRRSGEEIGYSYRMHDNEANLTGFLSS